MSIYHDLEAIKAVAMEYMKKDGYNYNVIIHNPNAKGEFDLEAGSTYEFVMDSYFNTPRPNVILLHKTKDLVQVEKNKIAIMGMGGIEKDALHAAIHVHQDMPLALYPAHIIPGRILIPPPTDPFIFRPAPRINPFLLSELSNDGKKKRRRPSPISCRRKRRGKIKNKNHGTSRMEKIKEGTEQ